MKFLVLEVGISLFFLVVASFMGAVAGQLRAEREWYAANVVAHATEFCVAATLLGLVVSASHGLILLTRWVFA